MVHFPASLSVSRLARSSDTQNVCRMTKSRNRTGSRAWRKFCVPPARPRSGSRRRRQQGPRWAVLRLRFSLPEGVAAPNRQLLRQQHFRRRCGVFAAVCCGNGRTSNGPTRFSGVAAGLFVSSTGIFINSTVCALWRQSSRQGRTERFRRKDDCYS